MPEDFWRFPLPAPLPPAPFALRGCQADVVHLHHPNPLGDIAWLLARPSGRLVITYHSDIITQGRLAFLYQPLLYRVLERAAAIVATSPHYMDSSPALSRLRDKVTIIPLGIDPPPPQWLNHPWPRPSDEPVFLFLGRLVPYKGLEVLLQALTQVPGRLWVAGSGPMAAAIRQKAFSLGLDGRVEFLGNISEEENGGDWRPAMPWCCPASPGPKLLASCCWRPWPRVNR